VLCLWASRSLSPERARGTLPERAIRPRASRRCPVAGRDQQEVEQPVPTASRRAAGRQRRRRHFSHSVFSKLGTCWQAWHLNNFMLSLRSMVRRALPVEPWPAERTRRRDNARGRRGTCRDCRYPSSCPSRRARPRQLRAPCPPVPPPPEERCGESRRGRRRCRRDISRGKPQTPRHPGCP